MTTQAALFEVHAEPHAPQQPPPTVPPVVLAEPLGPCVKCGAPATRQSPSGNPKSIYCAECGRCGGYHIDKQAVCGRSIETFVLHPRMGIWVCPCVGG